MSSRAKRREKRRPGRNHPYLMSGCAKGGEQSRGPNGGNGPGYAQDESSHIVGPALAPATFVLAFCNRARF